MSTGEILPRHMVNILFPRPNYLSSFSKLMLIKLWTLVSPAVKLWMILTSLKRLGTTYGSVKHQAHGEKRNYSCRYFYGHPITTITTCPECIHKQKGGWLLSKAKALFGMGTLMKELVFQWHEGYLASTESILPISSNSFPFGLLCPLPIFIWKAVITLSLTILLFSRTFQPKGLHGASGTVQATIL